MTRHTYSKVGRYECAYDTQGFVVFLDHVKGHELARFTLEPDLHEIATLLDNEEGEVGPLTREEIFFLIGISAAVDTILEHAPYDLERFGEIGVSG